MHSPVTSYIDAMAIARVNAVKRFRRALVRLKHPKVLNWTEKQLKNAVFRNDVQWLELLRWLLGELDDEIKECLSNCCEEERISRIKESILVLGLSSPQKIEESIKGRVVFKEREELITQLMDLVKMKKAIDKGGTPCMIQGHGCTADDIKQAKSPKSCKLTENSNEKTEVLTGRELFDLLVAKNPEYQRLVLYGANESQKMKELQAAFSEEENEEQEFASRNLENDDDSTSSLDVSDFQFLPQGDEFVDLSVLRRPKWEITRGKAGKMPIAIKKSETKLLKQLAKPPGLTTAAKELDGECSPDVSTNSKPSSPFVWNDGQEERCDTGLCPNLVNDSGAESKPLNYMDAVHDLVKDLERTCQMAK